MCFSNICKMSRTLNYHNCSFFLGKVYSFLTLEMLIPAAIQFFLFLFVTFVIPNSIILISIVIAISLFISVKLAKHELRSHLLYYWTVLSVVGSIIVYEFIIVPLLEISPTENFFLVLFSFLTFFFLYLTKKHSLNFLQEQHVEKNNLKPFMNGNSFTSLCPACRVRIYPKSYHCHICQKCITQYDHHSYWLDCCIGEGNLHYYVAGIFFGIFSLIYGSLLILTTVCSPDFKLGILVPVECTDVCIDTETCTSLICGIYCLELGVLLLFKLFQHIWLISLGRSTFAWQENFTHHISLESPYKNGFLNNWISFFSKFKKLHI